MLLKNSKLNSVSCNFSKPRLRRKFIPIVLLILVAIHSNLIICNSLEIDDRKNSNLKSHNQEIDDENNFYQNSNNDYSIDERFPIVISNGFNNGHNESHFGASVALIKYTLSDHTWLFIGEPRGNSTRTFKEPGVIWKCGLNFNSNPSFKTVMKDYCEMIEMDDITADSNTKVQVFGQTWFGGSISIINPQSQVQSPHLVTCSHRKSFPFNTNQKRITMSGACYILNVDQFNARKTNTVSSTNNNVASSNRNQNFNIGPGSVPTVVQVQVATKIEPSEAYILDPQQNNRRVYTFSHAAFGMSLNVNQDQVLVGAPGFDAIERLEVRELRLQSSSPKQNPFTRHTVAFTKIVNLNPHPTSYPPFCEKWDKEQSVCYPYYGYAVSSGNYYRNPSAISYSRKVNYFAGGRPRENNLRGTVWISRLPANSFVQLIEGFHMGSYFGSVLYTQDIDSDGIDELFIGAPYTGQLTSDFLSQQEHPFIAAEESTSSTSSANINSNNNNNKVEEDFGCVYVYQHKSEKKLEVVQILMGGNQRFSRFGSAVSSIEGFIVHPGTQSPKKHIVIGAPYENDNEGAVYFYDTKELLSTRKYSKRITASQLATGVFSSSKQFRAFGFSFSTNQENVDVDGNGTPDLVVGSYLSKDVVLLRTRHQIKLTGQVMKIVLDGGVEVNPSSFLFKKEDRKFQLRVYLKCIIPQRILNEKENLQFWSRIRVDAAELENRYRITTQMNFENPFEQIDSQTIEFSSFLLNDTTAKFSRHPNGNFTVAEFSTSFDVIRTKSFKPTEVSIPGIQMDLKSWYNTTQGLAPSRTDYVVIRNNEQEVILNKVEHNTNQNGQNNVEDHFGPYLPSPVSTQTLLATVNIVPNDCKVHSKCKPKLIIRNIQFRTPQGTPLVLQENSFTIGSYPEILLKWTIVNINQDNEVALLPGSFIQYSLDADSSSNTSTANNATKKSTSWSLLSLNDIGGCERVAESWSWFRCSKPGFLPPNKATKMEIRLQMAGLYPGKSEQKLTIQLTPTHAHDELELELELEGQGSLSNGHGISENVETKTVELKLLADSQITISGNRISRNISVDNKAFQHLYKVSLTGTSPIDKITLQFGIPLKRKVDAENLVAVYRPVFTDISSVKAATVAAGYVAFCSPTIPFAKSSSTTPNPTLKRTTSITTTMTDNAIVVNKDNTNSKIALHPVSAVGRRKRSIMNSTLIQRNHKNTKGKSLEFLGNETIELSCHHLGIKMSPWGLEKDLSTQDITCMYVQCFLYNVTNEASFLVEFPMQLTQQGSFAILSKQTSKNAILIKSVATAQILQAENPEIHIDTDVAEVKVRFHTVPEGEVPMWIYIAAAVGGFVFLLLFIMALNACGFFKRDMKVQLETLKRQSQVYDLNAMTWS